MKQYIPAYVWMRTYIAEYNGFFPNKYNVVWFKDACKSMYVADSHTQRKDTNKCTCTVVSF